MGRLCDALAAALCSLLLGCLVAGCSSGGLPAGPAPPPPATAAISGTVVDATDPTEGVSGAVITVQGGGVRPVTTTSAQDGGFSLGSLPAGTLTLDAVFPGLTAAYQPLSISVQTTANTTTTVVLAALPVLQTPGDFISISPASLTIDIGGRCPFGANVRRAGIRVSLSPSWWVTGGIGTISPTGGFVAATTGTGQVVATTGLASASAQVTVVGPRPPELGILQVSPATLESDGGNVRIATMASDGDGVTGVMASIELPTRAIVSLTLTRESGNEYNGTWASEYAAPPNTAPTDPAGGQPAQLYGVKVMATDASGASAESDWKNFTVAGLEAPPEAPF